MYRPHTNPRHYLSNPKLVAIVAALGVTAAGWGIYYISQASADQPAAGEFAAMPVSVLTVQPESVRTWTDFSGRLEAVDFVEVRSQVSGTVDHILFKDGAVVQKGDPLFVIDPRPFEAAVARSEAALTSAQTQANLARLELGRAQKLVKNKYVAQRVVDERANDVRVSEANITGAEAELKQARLNLEYAHIKAPITGRVSRAEITVGNVIEAGPNAPVLTSIVSNTPIYADFEVDEQTYLNSVRNGKAGATIPVELTLASDNSKTYKGHIQSFDNKLNPTSGTIRARAVLNNEDGALIPGMFANVKLGSSAEEKHILVSDRAVGTDQDKRFVYLVDKDNKVIYREVKLGATVNGQRIIKDGLKPGDRVVVNGLQRIRPDMVVAPQEVASGEQPPADKQASAAN